MIDSGTEASTDTEATTLAQVARAADASMVDVTAEPNIQNNTQGDSQGGAPVTPMAKSKTPRDQQRDQQQDLLNLPMQVPTLTRKVSAHAVERPVAEKSEAKPRIRADQLEGFMSTDAEASLRVPRNAVVLTEQGLSDLEQAVDQRVQRLLDRSLERTVDDLQLVIKTQLQQRIQSLLPGMISRAVRDELSKLNKSS